MLPAPPLYSCLDPDGGSSSSDASRLVKKAPLVLYAGEWAFFARPPLPSPYQSSSKALGWGGRETPIQKSMFFYGTSPGFSDFISREFLPRTPNFMHDLTQKPNCNTGHKGTPLVETGCLHGPHSLHRTTVLWVSWFLQSVYLPSCPRPFPHSSCLLLKD